MMTIDRFSQDTSLTDEIADILRERILNGRYSIGEKIIEALQGKELRLSRTPIDKLLKNWKTKGWLKTYRTGDLSQRVLQNAIYRTFMRCGKLWKPWQ